MKNGFTWNRSLKLAIAGTTFLFLGIRCDSYQKNSSPDSEQQAGVAEARFERGLQFAQAGNLQSAEDELRAAARLKPNEPEYLSSLATVLAIEKKFEDSTLFFEKALKIKPDDWKSRRDLAANFWQLHRYSEAKRQLELVVSRSPADAKAKLLLGLVSEKTGDYSTALKMFSTVPELVTTQPEALLALAKSYYRTGDAKNAAEALNALANGVAGPQGALSGAQIADEMRDYATAEKLLSTIPKESAEYRAARYRLAVVKFNGKQYQQSQKILEDLMNAGQKSGPLLRLAGWCYHKTNRDEDAIRTFRDAIQLDPADEKNFLDLGALLVEQRKLSAALELANRMVSAFPHSADALALLGFVEFSSERFTDAVQTYSRSLELNRDNGDAILGLAKSQSAAGTQSQAETTLEAAIQRFPGNASFELQLALLLLKKSEKQEPAQQARAEGLLRAAAKHDPNLAEPHYQLGDIALRRGQTTAATAHLENAVRISPESPKAHFALARAYRRSGRTEDAAKETALYEKLKDSGDSEPQNSSHNANPGK